MGLAKNVSTRNVSACSAGHCNIVSGGLTHGAVVAEPLPPRLDDLRGGRGAEERGQHRHPHQVHRGGGEITGSAGDISWHASLYYLPIYFRYSAT